MGFDPQYFWEACVKGGLENSRTGVRKESEINTGKWGWSMVGLVGGVRFRTWGGFGGIKGRVGFEN